jgi:hypothetical protein
MESITQNLFFFDIVLLVSKIFYLRDGLIINVKQNFKTYFPHILMKVKRKKERKAEKEMKY